MRKPGVVGMLFAAVSFIVAAGAATVGGWRVAAIWFCMAFAQGAVAVAFRWQWGRA